MNFKIILFLSRILIFIISISNYNLLAEDFSDLEETRVKVYGSEKDKKYRLDGFFIEWENWPRENPSHNHFHFFWFANTTNYPKFKKNQVFPFFSNIESKIDPRKSTNYLLLYNSSVDRDKNETTILFPFYFAGNSSINKSNYLGIFPFFYKSNKNLNSYNESKLLLPGFYKTSTNDFKNKESSKFSISPFYVSNSSKSQDIEYSKSWFPIIPFYYTSEDNKNKHNNIAWLLDTNRNKLTEKIDRFWFLPIFYWKKEEYLNIFPLYFNTLSKTEDSDDWFGIIPPIYRSYSPNHSTFYFLNFYKSTQKISTTKDSFTIFFPFYFHSNNNQNESFTLFPILYLNQKDKDSSSHTNLLLLYDHGLDKDSNLDRLWLMPFYFYKKDAYNYIVPFFFQNSTNNKQQNEMTSNSWFGILPPIYRSYSQNHSTFYLINFFTSNKKDKSKEENVTTFFPFYFHSDNSLNESMTFIPLLYYNNRETTLNSHTNVLLAYDHSLDNEGNLNRLWIVPFYFYKKNSYKYIVPFYFSNDESSQPKDSTIWGPFYYIKKTESVQEKYFLLYYESQDKGKFIDSHITNIFPFFYSWDSKTSKVIQAKTELDKGFYLFPIFYKNENTNKETYSNLVGLVSWTKDNKDELIQNTIFPVRFYKKDSYSIWFPFSFQFGKTETSSKAGKRWGAFFYSSWSPEEEKLWIFNYYSDQDKKNELHSKTFFPIYHSWKKENSNGTLVFPFYIDADFRDEKDKDKFDNFNLNILGIASQTSKGIFQPSFSFDGGKKSKYYYLDTDISWLYYAFRISNRTSNKFIKDLLPGENPDPSSLGFITSTENSKSPRVNSKKSFTREDSFNFIGVNVLFGVFGYEAADTQRHIRLLPLAWFTYDTEVDENIYAGPLPLPFVWYSSANLKYRVIFPIYGYQNSEDAERHSYGLFIFLKEALVENNTKETSVVWPLINWHDSDIKSGSRVLPFYWQRTSKEDKDISDSLIVPIGLTYLNKTTNNKNITTKTWISPFLFRNDSVFEDGKIERIYSPFALFYWSSSDTSKVADKVFLSPIFFNFATKQKDNKQTQFSNFWLVPIVGFESESNDDYWLNYFVLYNKSKSAKEDSITIFPFYNETNQYNKNELVNQSNFYFPLFPILTSYKPIHSENTKEQFRIISPFLFSTSIKTKEESLYREQLYPIPLFYSEFDKSSDTNFYSLLLLFQFESKPTEEVYRIFPILQLSNHTVQTNSTRQSRNWILPLYWKSNYEYIDKNLSQIEEKKFISLPYASFSSKENNTIVVPPLLYYSTSNNEENFQSIFFLANHTENEEFESYNFFPFYHYFSTKPSLGKSSENDEKIKTKDKLSSNQNSIKNPRKNNLIYTPNIHYVNRLFPFYSYKTTDTNSGTPVSKEFLSIFYTLSSEYKKSGELDNSTYWIPLLLYSNERNQIGSEWTWLFFIRSNSSANSNTMQIFPIFHTSTSTENTIVKNKNWLFPIYFFNTELSTKNDNIESLTILPFLLYYSSSDKDEEYYNWMFIANYKNSYKSNSANFFPFYHYYSTNPSYKGEQEYKNRFIPFYSYSSKTSTDGKPIETNFLSLFYAKSSSYNEKAELNLSKFWIPIALYSQEHTPSSSEWTWLFFIKSESSAVKDSFNIYPIYHSSSSKEIEANKSKNWFFPLYFYTSEQSNDLTNKSKQESINTKLKPKENKILNNEIDSKHFVSLFFRYSSYLKSKQKDDYHTSLSFPILPLIYSESSLDASHLNLFYLFDRKVEEDQLTRFFLFPYYYENDDPKNTKSTSYHHLIPFYFSGLDNEEYTAFISGLYINSNKKSSYKNFLFLLEQESIKDLSALEFNLLFRALHYKTTDSTSNFKFIYGLGEIDLKEKQTQMNLAWLGYENKPDSNYLNLLPLYYKDVTKSKDYEWITPLLYFSKINPKEKLEHSTLGLVYYNSENLETKESLQSVLLGILYYKTVKPKERGYTGRGSLWGALWEYNTEDETNYSKFSILKILYSRREDDQGVRHRILFLEF